MHCIALKVCLFVLFIVVSHFNLLAQEEDINFENLSTISGLSAPRAKCLMQDSEGYLWSRETRNSGLNRYDGYNFKVFRHSANDSTGLQHDNVYSIAEDSKGNIWIATFGGGLNKWEPSSRRCSLSLNFTTSKEFDILNFFKSNFNF